MRINNYLTLVFFWGGAWKGANPTLKMLIFSTFVHFISPQTTASSKFFCFRKMYMYIIFKSRQELEEITTPSCFQEILRPYLSVPA